MNRRFHPDGTLAQDGQWCGGQQWQGTYRWIKSDFSTPEYFPEAKNNSSVWTIEYDYTGDGTTYNAQRYFDRQNNPVNANGTPLPTRPASIPDRAYFVDVNQSRHILAHWVTSEISPWKNIFVGDYAEWDLDGKLLLKRVFDRDTGMLVEEHIAAVVPQQVINDYHPHTDTPIVHRSRCYSYNGNDYTEIFFDETGKLLYAVRQQYVTRLHTRRFYNDVLVYEIIHSIDNTSSPVSVRYFYPGGTILIDYTSNGNGTGTWHMYDEAGQTLWHMLQENEADINKDNRWNYFLPKLTSDPEYPSIAIYVDTIVQEFRREHDLYVIENKIKVLPIPDFLQAELNKVDWINIETACGGGRYLPEYINGLLSEDEAVVAECLKRIWWEIEYQGELYDATYATANVVAYLLPFYKEAPVIEQRLLSFLYQVMTQPNLRNSGYDETVSSPYLMKLIQNTKIDHH